MKAQIVSKVAGAAKISKAQAGRALKAFFDGITTDLKRGKRVTFVGFGTFNISKRKARQGRNPQTGEPIKIKAARVPKFKAGKGLKDALN